MTLLFDFSASFQAMGRRPAAYRALVLLGFAFLLLMVCRGSADAQESSAECPAYPLYEADIVNLYAPWASMCGHCILPAGPTPTPTLPIFATSTPTRTPTLSPTASPTRTPTLTPSISPTATGTVDPSIFREFGNGYASFYVGSQDAAVGYSTVFNLPAMAGLLGRDWDIVGFGWEIFSYSVPSPAVQMGISSPQAVAVNPNRWLSSIVNLEVAHTGCADAEIYAQSFDDLCNTWLNEVAYFDGFAYHEVGRFIGGEQETSIGFGVLQPATPNAPATPTLAAPQIYFYIRLHLLLKDRSFEFDGVPTATPTVGTPEPVCETIQPFDDFPVFDELYWSNIHSLSNPNNPANHDAPFEYPSGQVMIHAGWGSFGLWGTAQDFWVGDTITSKTSTFPGDGNVRRSSAGGIIALGGAADLDGLGWTVTYSTPPSAGTNWPAVYSLIWTWNTVEGQWEAYSTTIINPSPWESSSNEMTVYPQDASYVFVMIQVDSYSGVLAEFTVSPRVHFNGEWLEIGDELCIVPPLTTPTPTPTIDLLGPTWTLTATRTPILTYTPTASRTPSPTSSATQLSNSCTQPIWRTTPTVTLAASSTPTTTLTPSLNATTTLAALTQTPTLTRTALASTLQAQMSQTATASTPLPFQTQAAQTQNAATSAAAQTLTATAVFPVTATYIAGSTDRAPIATSQAIATYFTGVNLTSTAIVDGGGGGGNSSYDINLGGPPSVSDTYYIDGSPRYPSLLRMRWNWQPKPPNCFTFIPEFKLPTDGEDMTLVPEFKLCIAFIEVPSIEIVGYPVPVSVAFTFIGLILLRRLLWTLAY